MAAAAAPSSTTQTFEAISPGRYRITWTGPWLDQQGQPLWPAGNYTAVIQAIRTGGAVETSNPYDRISLVEVTEIRIEPPDGVPDPQDYLSTNPAVPAVPGQDAGLGRPEAGKRIFAEARTHGGQVYNRVKVTAVITPTIAPDSTLPPAATTVRVHFRSFDVDDPAPYEPDLDGDTAANAVADNRGTPANGTIVPFIDVLAGGDGATTDFAVSLQPGDNYRVAASTHADWLTSLHAEQRVLPHEEGPVQDGRLNVQAPNISDMLTVWRTLHLEIDSMAAPPPESTPPTAPEYKERNFIKGRVLRITVVAPPSLDQPEVTTVIEPRYIYVEAESTEPPLKLSDGSAEMPGPNGRFEQGKITIGTGATAVVVDPLDGNGTDSATGWEFVRAITTPPPPPEPPQPPRIIIPFTLTNGTLRTLTGRALAWDAATRVFTLTQTISPLYVGGTLRLAGMEWTVGTVNGADVTVVEDQPIPFVLVDDDPPATSFPISSVYLTDNDDPTQNVFALAYIRPRRDLASAIQPPFMRNVRGDEWPPLPQNQALRRAQLAAGREYASAPSFWVVYAQGAAQADAKKDADPDQEGQWFGWSEGYDDQHGVFVYFSAIDDHTSCPRPDQVDHTTAHEIGHQFGIWDNTGAIMNWVVPPACERLEFFMSHHLAAIRAKGATP